MLFLNGKPVKKILSRQVFTIQAFQQEGRNRILSNIFGLRRLSGKKGPIMKRGILRRSDRAMVSEAVETLLKKCLVGRVATVGSDDGEVLQSP